MMMKVASIWKHSRISNRFSWLLATAYVGVGALWILFSDQFLAYLTTSPRELTELQHYKGWLFVFGTGLLLYWFARRHLGALDLSERQLHKLSRAVEASPSAIMITDTRGRLEYCNPKFVQTTGYSNEEVMGRDLDFLLAGEGADPAYDKMREAVTRGDTWYGEFHKRAKDGRMFWWLMTVSPIRDNRGNITGFVHIAEDVGELKYAEDTIQRLAYYDPLTALPNRVLFRDRLEQAVAAARSYGGRLGLLFIDLDRFKHINDTLGHEQGDALLRMVAERLGHCADEKVTLARLGGDEFAVIIPDIGLTEDVRHCAERVNTTLSEPFTIGGQELFLSASVGVSVFPEDAGDAEGLVANADLAMFRAKDSGRSTFQFYTEDMNTATLELLSLEANLRHAITRDELRVFYQPKVDLRTGQMSGMEALARWQQPEMGMVPPDRFIPLAEQTGLIFPLGEWVLREACRQTRQWQQQGHPGLRVAVNISAHQFRRGDLPQIVAAALEESGLPAECLELEITEHDIMADTEAATATLQELKRMGLRISIDDFGTGYSSLNYLKRFPIDTLKVDRSFVSDVTEDADDAAIARAVIALAHSMRLQVVAEGVETAQQLAFFRSEGCDEVQGYYFSRAVDGESFAPLLAREDWLDAGEGG